MKFYLRVIASVINVYYTVIKYCVSFGVIDGVLNR